MTGIAFVQRFRRIEELANRLGFCITASKHFTREYDVVALRPLDADSLPVYSRDAELFVGSIEELERWLQGVEWSRNYDRLLFGNRHDAARIKREGIERTRQVFNILRDESTTLIDK